MPFVRKAFLQGANKNVSPPSRSTQTGRTPDPCVRVQLQMFVCGCHCTVKLHAYPMSSDGQCRLSAPATEEPASLYRQTQLRNGLPSLIKREQCHMSMLATALLYGQGTWQLRFSFPGLRPRYITAISQIRANKNNTPGRAQIQSQWWHTYLRALPELKLAHLDALHAGARRGAPGRARCRRR